MDLFILSSYKPGKKSSPKWFNSQFANAVKHKNHRFKQCKLHQTPHSRASFVQARNLCSKIHQSWQTSFVKRINNETSSCQTGCRSFWFVAKVVSQNFCHSSFPSPKTTLAHLHALHPLMLIFLHQPLLPIPILKSKISNLLSTPHPPSQCPLSSSLHAKSGKPFFSSTPPNLVDLMVYLL